MRSSDLWKDVARAIEGGRVTLVLGAGVSMPFGVPGWEALARRVWQEASPERPLPAAGDLPGQLLPILFELASEELGDRRFNEVLRAQLYSHVTLPDADGLKSSTASLAVVARILAKEFEAGSNRRLARVITLNADDLLENAANRVAGHRVTQHIGNSSQSPERWRGDWLIPVYHLHGMVPRDGNAPYSRSYEHTLVFTDSQYWASTTGVLSLANTTMGTALHDSHCIFVGLSMADANVLRWLALRHLEFLQEGAERSGRARTDLNVRPEVVLRQVRAKLRRHFWVRPDGNASVQLLSDFLSKRGVTSVPINGWDTDDFAKLMDLCFR